MASKPCERRILVYFSLQEDGKQALGCPIWCVSITWLSKGTSLARLPLVAMGQAPSSRLERWAVVEAMVDHAATARSGDHTLAAAVRAVRDIAPRRPGGPWAAEVKEEADDYFVFLVSDVPWRFRGRALPWRRTSGATA